MRTSLMLPLIASTSLAAGCGGGAPKSPQEVGDRVVAALVAKDWEAAKKMFWTVDDFNSKCADFPAEKKAGMAEEFAEELADAEQDFKKCLATDWTSAKVTGVKGGEAGEAVEGCGGAVLEAKDVVVSAEVGGKKMQIKVNDPAKIGDAYYLIEGFRCKSPEMSCEDVYDNLTNIVKGATDAKDREKEMFSGTAEKKSEFATMCGQMKSEPMFGEILTCMGNATTYAEMKACEKKMDGDKKDEAVADKPATDPVVAAPEPPAAPAPAAPAAPAGSGACDKYTTKMMACADAMPEPTREQMKKGLQTMKDTLGSRPPEEQNVACGAAIEAAKKAMGTMCPAVVWD